MRASKNFGRFVATARINTGTTCQDHEDDDAVDDGVDDAVDDGVDDEDDNGDDDGDDDGICMDMILHIWQERRWRRGKQFWLDDHGDGTPNKTFWQFWLLILL